MKNLTQYLKLWEKKRDELRVDTDAGNDWLDMKALLDKHMPVNDNSAGSAPKKGISLFTTLLITLSAAAMLYVGHAVFETKKKTAYRKDQLHHKKHGALSEIDSLNVSDNLRQIENQIINGDSISATQNNVRTANTTSNEVNKNNGKLPGKADSVNSKNISGQSHEQNTVKSTDQSTYDKELNLHPDSGKRNNNIETDEQSSNLLSNSSRLLSKSDAKGLNLLGSGNKRNYLLTKTRHRDPDGAAESNNRFNDNNLYTETDHKTANRTRHHNSGNPVLLSSAASQGVETSQGLLNIYPTLNNKQLFQISLADASKTRKNGSKPPSHINLDALEWGVLIGANSSGSFTSTNLNKNFYGSLPADLFAGIYGTYNLNGKWGVGTQIALLTPQIAKGGIYSRPYLFYTDSNVTTKHKLISNPKKVYSIQLPVYTTYKVAQNINLKAGPVVSFPIKQSNAAQVDSISRDLLNHSHYDQKIDFSFAAGINYQYKRLIFEANYLKGLKQHSIMSDSLIHRSANNTFQFSIKFQLGGKKK